MPVPAKQGKFYLCGTFRKRRLPGMTLAGSLSCKWLMTISYLSIVTGS